MGSSGKPQAPNFSVFDNLAILLITKISSSLQRKAAPYTIILNLALKPAKSV
jgi:hypothetical protein